MGAARNFFGEKVTQTNLTLPTVSPSVEPALTNAPISNVTQEMFLPHLGTEFSISHAQHPGLACVLKEVSEVSTSGNDKVSFTSFSLLFEAPPSFLAESDVCAISHPVLGNMDMFLVRVGSPKKVTRLQAIFSSRVA